jgi:hypothetical protein
LVAVHLPGGYWYDGKRHRQAELRALSGADEASLAEAAAVLAPAELAVEILRRCLTVLGPLRPPDTAALRGLLIGDCEALLLHVQRISYGERIECLVPCPRPECDTPLECVMEASSLLVPPSDDLPLWHEEPLAGVRRRAPLRFRLPTVGDREQVLPLAQRDPEAATTALLGALLAPETRSDTRRLRPALGARLAALDPQAEIRLTLSCPACGQPISVLFDACRHLIDTIRQHARMLFQEVHRLARTYHWSEHDILGLSHARRRLYLDLVASEAAP